ncbi:MAG: hypothetical protein NTW32_27730, partial [Chloroflexi bacterium]|nr:hypothetical protein [Chloroflexota bacterium]
GQVRFANTSTSKSITVNIYMGNTLLGSYPLGPSASGRVDFPGQNNGPLHVASADGTPIIASIGTIQSSGGTQTSFGEINGFPGNQLTTKYWFPWYNNFNFDTQLRISNP